MRTCLIVFMLLCGCGNQTDPVIAKAEDTRSLREDWLRQYTSLTNRFTERTYGCISEMYSLVYHPVNSGPVCKESCDLRRQVNEMVANAPAYIERPGQYTLPESKVCQPKHKKEPK